MGRNLSTEEFQSICIKEVVKWFNSRTENISNQYVIGEKDVYVVWYAKTLQNNKALLSTTVADGMYYECTYNGDKGELYFDAYRKYTNKIIKID